MLNYDKHEVKRVTEYNFSRTKDSPCHHHMQCRRYPCLGRVLQWPGPSHELDLVPGDELPGINESQTLRQPETRGIQHGEPGAAI